MTETNKAFTVYTDGGSRGNPGPAAFSYVIYNPNGSLVAEKAQYIGVTTNNQAEYQGIVAALEALLRMRITHPIICKLDSQLVVRQIRGMYRIKNENLKPWLEKVHELQAKLSVPIMFIDIPRDENKQADTLVNVALDGAERKSPYGSETVTPS